MRNYECKIFQLPDGWRWTYEIKKGLWKTLYRIEEPKIENGQLKIEIIEWQ